MAKIVYHIVQHDGGWAYQVDGAYSETFISHDAARTAALRAAGEQRVSGDDAAIGYEDEQGVWREELASGADRPETDVEG